VAEKLGMRKAEFGIKEEKLAVFLLFIKAYLNVITMQVSLLMQINLKIRAAN